MNLTLLLPGTQQLQRQFWRAMGLLHETNGSSTEVAFLEALGGPGARYRKLAMRCRASAEEAHAGESRVALLQMALAYDRRAVELEANAGLTANRASDGHSNGAVTGFFPAECRLAFIGAQLAE